MALPAFPTTVNPVMPLTLSETPRIKSMVFGDGYSQRAPDGINYMDESYDLSYVNITLVEKNEIRDFLRARGGYAPFSYTFEGDTGTWVSNKWSSTKTHPNAYSLSVTIDRVYDQ